MKTVGVIFFVLLSYSGFCQYGLDDIFKGGRHGYADFIYKQSRYGDAGRGKYGLCLFSFTLHSNDSTNNIRVISSPSALISARTMAMFKLSAGRWLFPEHEKSDSLTILAGVYYIKTDNDVYNNKEDYTRLNYDLLYKEYNLSGFETQLPEVFITPFIFIGIVTVKRYGTQTIRCY